MLINQLQAIAITHIFSSVRDGKWNTHAHKVANIIDRSIWFSLHFVACPRFETCTLTKFKWKKQQIVTLTLTRKQKQTFISFDRMLSGLFRAFVDHLPNVFALSNYGFKIARNDRIKKIEKRARARSKVWSDLIESLNIQNWNNLKPRESFRVEFDSVQRSIR